MKTQYIWNPVLVNGIFFLFFWWNVWLFYTMCYFCVRSLFPLCRFGIHSSHFGSAASESYNHFYVEWQPIYIYKNVIEMNTLVVKRKRCRGNIEPLSHSLPSKKCDTLWYLAHDTMRDIYLFAIDLGALWLCILCVCASVVNDLIKFIALSVYSTVTSLCNTFRWTFSVDRFRNISQQEK